MICNNRNEKILIATNTILFPRVCVRCCAVRSKENTPYDGFSSKTHTHDDWSWRVCACISHSPHGYQKNYFKTGLYRPEHASALGEKNIRCFSQRLIFVNRPNELQIVPAQQAGLLRKDPATLSSSRHHHTIIIIKGRGNINDLENSDLVFSGKITSSKFRPQGTSNP